MKFKSKLILTTGCVVTFILTFVGLSSVLNAIGANGKIHYIVGSFCLLIAFCLTLIAGIVLYFVAQEIGIKRAVTVVESGIIEKKHYTPSSTSIGTGLSLNTTNGQVAPVIMNSHASARFTLEIRLSSDKIARLGVSESDYDCLAEGDSVNVSYRISTFDGSKHWSDTVQKIQ